MGAPKLKNPKKTKDNHYMFILVNGKERVFDSTKFINAVRECIGLEPILGTHESVILAEDKKASGWDAWPGSNSRFELSVRGRSDFCGMMPKVGDRNY